MISQDTQPNNAAPGCYGAASVYGTDSKVCMACPFYEPCGEAARQTLEQIRDRIDVSAILERHAITRLRAYAEIDARAALAQANSADDDGSKPIKKKQALQMYAVAAGDQLVIQGLTNRNAKQLAIALCKTLLLQQIVPSVKEGKNPFERIENWAYMRVACQVLIEDGGFTKQALAKRLQVDLGWTSGTAESHRAFILVVLMGFGILNENNGYYTLKS